MFFHNLILLGLYLDNLCKTQFKNNLKETQFRLIISHTLMCKQIIRRFHFQISLNLMWHSAFYKNKIALYYVTWNCSTLNRCSLRSITMFWALQQSIRSNDMIMRNTPPSQSWYKSKLTCGVIYFFSRVVIVEKKMNILRHSMISIVLCQLDVLRVDVQEIHWRYNSKWATEL